MEGLQNIEIQKAIDSVELQIIHHTQRISPAKPGFTNNNARRWVKSNGMIYRPRNRLTRHRLSQCLEYRGVPVNAQFNFDDKANSGEAATRPILEVSSFASQALVVVEDHPLTDEGRRVRLSNLRTALGESWSLEEAPGLPFSPSDKKFAELLRICIGSGSWWSVYIYLGPIGTTLLIWESSIIDLGTERKSDCKLLEKELRLTAPPNFECGPAESFLSQCELGIALIEAATEGDLERVERLLKNGASIDASSAFSASPLLSALAAGHHNIAERLMEAGPNLLTADRQQKTALIWAVHSQLPKLVQRLVGQNIPLDTVDQAGFTALDYAIT